MSSFHLAFTWLSEIGFLEGSKVENEKNVEYEDASGSKAIRWNQVKSGDDAAEKLVSDDAKKTLAEATQLLKSVYQNNRASHS